MKRDKIGAELLGVYIELYHAMHARLRQLARQENSVKFSPLEHLFMFLPHFVEWLLECLYKEVTQDDITNQGIDESLRGLWTAL